MKLNPTGTSLVRAKTRLDRKIMKMQEIYGDEGLSVWGTEGCDRCGACCYVLGVGEDFSIKKDFEKCEYLEEDGDCKIHDNGKPIECIDGFTCYDTQYFGRGTPFQRYRMMLVAVEILKTKTEKDIRQVADSFVHVEKPKAEPVELTEEEIKKQIKMLLG